MRASASWSPSVHFAASTTSTTTSAPSKAAAAARAPPLDGQPEAGHLAAHPESLRMVLAFDPEDGIAWQGKTARLQVLLQARLGVLERRRLRQRRDAGSEQPRDDPVHGGEPAIEENRPTQRFQRVG